MNTLVNLAGLSVNDFAGAHILLDFEDKELKRSFLADWKEGPLNRFTPVDAINELLSYGWKVVLGNQELCWLRGYNSVGLLRESMQGVPIGAEVNWDSEMDREKEYTDSYNTVSKYCHNHIIKDEILYRYNRAIKIQDLEDVDDDRDLALIP